MDKWQKLFQFISEQRRGKRRFPRGEGVKIAFKSVNLAVVGDGAKRMRKFPCRERVGGVTLVDDCER